MSVICCKELHELSRQLRFICDMQNEKASAFLADEKTYIRSNDPRREKRLADHESFNLTDQTKDLGTLLRTKGEEAMVLEPLLGS